MNIRQATTEYEAWLARQIPLLPHDLRLKHQWMRQDSFMFLRATFYRWAQLWPQAAAKFGPGPVVLSVGDLHVENFGTWRDLEGRLVWGVNDIDEAFPLPCTNDLARLTVSAFLAVEQLNVSAKDAAAEILRGYQDCLKAGGEPFVLGDRSTPLREMARHRLNHPEKFWEKMRRLLPLKSAVPAGALDAVKSILPDEHIRLRFAHRLAGLGSLGRQRYTGVGVWRGGEIAREAKSWTLSACLFAEGKGRGPLFQEDLVRGSVHAHDPYWKIKGAWVARRLSPDCFRLELSHLPKKRDERHLLYCMGWETANIHLGSGKGAAIRRDLRRKPPHWLFQAANIMREQTLNDWREWRK